jgi:hypothetical protein
VSIWLLYQRGVTAGYSGGPTSHRPLHVIFSGGFMLLILAGRCSCSDGLFPVITRTAAGPRPLWPFSKIWVAPSKPWELTF